MLKVGERMIVACHIHLGLTRLPNFSRNMTLISFVVLIRLWKMDMSFVEDGYVFYTPGKGLCVEEHCVVVEEKVCGGFSNVPGFMVMEVALSLLFVVCLCCALREGGLQREGEMREERVRDRVRWFRER